MKRSALGLLGVGVVLGALHCGAADRGAFGEDGSPADGAPPTPEGFAKDGGAADGASSAACTQDVDVVLVLDVSSSMGFVLDQLDAEIDKVVTAANGLKQGAHFGLVFFVDNAVLDRTGDLEGGRVHTRAASMKTAFVGAKATYTKPNRNPGDGPTGPTTQNPICEENALDALHEAAQAFPWRPSAARVVIAVTDDTFLEAGDNYGDRDGDGKTDKTDFPREGNYPARFGLDETIGALKDQKARVFSFTRLAPPDPFDLGKCGTGRRHSSDESIVDGWSKPYAGKAPIPEQTRGKNFDLDEVRDGKRSLSETISEVVLESHCAPDPR